MPDKCFPLYDAYKLLMFSLYTMLGRNEECYKGSEFIAKYFVKGSIRSALEDQRDYFFMLPYNDITATIDDLISYINDNFDTSYIFDNEKVETGDGIRILSCDSEHCESVSNLLSRITGDTNLSDSMDVIELYDRVTDRSLPDLHPEPSRDRLRDILDKGTHKLRKIVGALHIKKDPITRDLFYLYYNAINEIATRYRMPEFKPARYDNMVA
jgi:hypothetical protein